jgi:general stress protein YciG
MTKSIRGFAAMTPEKRREISRKGGQAAQARGAAHTFTRQEAQMAGRKGGTAVSQDRAHMATIGRKGGQKRKEGVLRASSLHSHRPRIASEGRRRVS